MSFSRRLAAPTTFVALIGFMLIGSACGQSSNPTSPTTTTTTNPTTPTAPCTPTPTNPECVNPPNLLTVTIQNNSFSPNPVTVKVGQMVNWVNRDGVNHTATDAGVFDTGSIPAGSAHDNAVTFNTPGTFNYTCTLHSGENASIVVQP